MAKFIDMSAITLKIPSGTQPSNFIAAVGIVKGGNTPNVPPTQIAGWFGDADAITIFTPATLDVHTFQILLTYDAEPQAYGTGNWFVWNNGSVNVTLPNTGGQAITYPCPIATGMLIYDSTGNVGADRSFKLIKQYNAY